MTKRQTEIVAFMTQFQKDHGYSPTFGDIMRHLGITLATVHEHMQVLVKKGVVNRYPGVRGYSLVDHCPLCGQELKGAAGSQLNDV